MQQVACKRRWQQADRQLQKAVKGSKQQRWAEGSLPKAEAHASKRQQRAQIGRKQVTQQAAARDSREDVWVQDS